jgi:hypothetical protein
MNRAGLFLCLGLLLLSSAIALPAAAPGAPSKVYIQVIWGTDQVKPTGTSYREIGPKLSGRLSPVFKWKHYWETERRAMTLDPSNVTKVQLANQRVIELERLKSGETEVRLSRKSGLISKTRTTLRNGCMAILGGERKSKDSFFIVVRADEPTSVE